MSQMYTPTASKAAHRLTDIDEKSVILICINNRKVAMKQFGREKAKIPFIKELCWESQVINSAVYDHQVIILWIKKNKTTTKNPN